MTLIRALVKVKLCIALMICNPFYIDISKAERCKKYSAKLKEVQVYKEPSEDAERLKSLKLGEEVCYLGEVSSFAIIEIDPENKTAKDESQLSPDDVAYVRLTDLWEPESKKKKKTQKEHVKDFFKFWQRGGVADDPLAPFRSLWGGEGPEIECTAGKICDAVEKKLEELDDS